MPKRLDPELVERVVAEYGDVPATEIARKNGITVGSVYSIVSRSKKNGRVPHSRGRKHAHVHGAKNGERGEGLLAAQLDQWWGTLSEADKQRVCLEHLLASRVPGGVENNLASSF